MALNEKGAEKKELELYFHIPFCVRKCLYCDFLSAPAAEGTKRKYMEALLAETVGSVPCYAGYSVTSVFIGGGTPSTVPVDCIERLMEAVRKYYRLNEDAEVTMEVNPGTVGLEALVRLRSAGINRLSIGLQSADDALLAALGRIHTWRQFADAFASARRAGFDNINVDIMSALPGQTLSGYLETLGRVCALEPPPEHISAYSLILEEGTYLYDMHEKGRLVLPDEETDRLMYQKTKAFLAKRKYHRYEISNYARKGFECRHNCGYWRRKDYAGFGIGAASLVENVRFHNGTDLDAYLAKPLGCREEVRHLSLREQMEEFMFLGLRMTDGVSLGEFRHLFGSSMEDVYGDVLRKNIHDGLLKVISSQGEGEARPCSMARNQKGEIAGRFKVHPMPPGPGEAGGSRDGRRLALTERGLDLSNYVMAQFLGTVRK